jgi:hypothetical protein
MDKVLVLCSGAESTLCSLLDNSLDGTSASCLCAAASAIMGCGGEVCFASPSGVGLDYDSTKAESWHFSNKALFSVVKKLEEVVGVESESLYPTIL